MPLCRNAIITIYALLFNYQPECQNVADKYIEYELILVCIDVILHRKQAFRHFLFNRRSLTHEIKVLSIIYTRHTCILYLL